jgi:hypothetical protein
MARMRPLIVCSKCEKRIGVTSLDGTKHYHVECSSGKFGSKYRTELQAWEETAAFWQDWAYLSDAVVVAEAKKIIAGTGEAMPTTRPGQMTLIAKHYMGV